MPKAAKYGVVLTMLLIIITYSFNSYLYELKVNGQKYVFRNIPQNEGLHKAALIAIKHVLNVMPSYEYIDISRAPSEVGVGNVKSLSMSALLNYDNIYVSSSEAIIAALHDSQPGTVINVLAGNYSFSGRYVSFDSSGAKASPVILRASSLGEVVFDMNLKEGFLLSGANLIIENIAFIGRKDDSIEHAFHIVGNADNITIRNNEFINFNAHIKANGLTLKDGTRAYPDNVSIVNNNFYNEWKRNTKSPATPIDVVGGENWLIDSNFVADFAKYGRKGKGITYGMFLKGASEGGVISNNLVNCAWKIPHTSPNDIRIGISLGNGGTGKKFCMDGSCQYEHKNGKIINNTILNCANDVGIYINKGLNTEIANNYLSNTLGIEVRYPESSVLIHNNYLDARIKATHDASISVNKNYKTSDFLP